MPVDPIRDAAVDVLLRVFERGMRLDHALDRTLRRRADFSERGRRFLTQLAYGVVRHKTLCDHILEGLLRQPLGELPPPLLQVLRMGVFQALFCGNVTRPAMVHTSVDLARKRGNSGLARLANAILRKAPDSIEQARLPDAQADPARRLAIEHSMPPWIVERWIDEHGLDTAARLCAASNEQAPAVLRVNTARIDLEALRARMARSGFVCEKRTPVPEELTLAEGASLARSKLFREGLFLLQDPASMLPPHLLEPQPGNRVLDLCAAPGGKTSHLAQLAPDARILALELQPGRIATIRENFERLGLPMPGIVCGDGKRPPFDCEFDRVLVDAPCSGLGTLRRRPDLKWRMQPEAIKRLAREQARLLRSAIRHCTIGGLIVYAVCTFTRAETENLIEAILAGGQVRPEDGPEWLAPWRIRPGLYRILPLNGALDGFFLTRLRKVS